MFIFRWIGIWLLLFGLVALAIDGTQSLADNQLVMTSVLEHWGAWSIESLKAAKSYVEQEAGSAFWDPGLLFILNRPSWAVLGVLGLLIYWIGRKRNKPDPFIN